MTMSANYAIRCYLKEMYKAGNITDKQYNEGLMALNSRR